MIPCTSHPLFFACPHADDARYRAFKSLPALREFGITLGDEPAFDGLGLATNRLALAEALENDAALGKLIVALFLPWGDRRVGVVTSY